MLKGKTNKCQTAEIYLKFYKATISDTNITIADFVRQIFDVFDKDEDCIAARNHIRCTVPKHTGPEVIYEVFIFYCDLKMYVWLACGGASLTL